ncbi:hypothetical protein EOM89_11490 [Candidatus Falkowbacteria bacterium]|nr:hypothetical protein [Candidatus Falkowbacteria bacterium]
MVHITIIQNTWFWELNVGRAVSPDQDRPVLLSWMFHKGTYLSGLLRCSHCGGKLAAHDAHGKRSVRCLTRQETGACENRRRYLVEAIEAVVIDGVAARLSHPAALAEFIAGLNDPKPDAEAARAAAEKRAASARAKLDRLSRFLVEGRIEADFFDREAPSARDELRQAEAELAALSSRKVARLDVDAAQLFGAAMSNLAPILRDLDAEKDAALVGSFRSMIDRVVIHDLPGGGLEAEVICALGPLLAPGEEETSGSPFATPSPRGTTALAPLPLFPLGRYVVPLSPRSRAA